MSSERVSFSEQARRDEAQQPRRVFDSGREWTRPPIFVIGFNKNGTGNLHEWFMEEGVASLHFGGYHTKNNVAARMFTNYSSGLSLLHGFDAVEAFSDMVYADEHLVLEANRLFAQMYREHRDAYFILNHRPVDDWINSRGKHTDKSGTVERYAHALGEDTAEVARIWQHNHARHHTEVRAFFDERPSARFLDVQVDEDFAPRVAEFLSPDYTLDPAKYQNRSPAERPAATAHFGAFATQET